MVLMITITSKRGRCLAMAEVKNKQYNEWLVSIKDFISIFIIDAHHEKARLDKICTGKSEKLKEAHGLSRININNHKATINKAKREVWELYSNMNIIYPQNPDLERIENFEKEDQLYKEVMNELSQIHEDTRVLLSDFPAHLSGSALWIGYTKSDRKNKVMVE
jgi:hypothetical protein